MHKFLAVGVPSSRHSIGASAEWRPQLGRALIVVPTFAILGLIVGQLLKTAGVIDGGFNNWRPVALALLVWSACFCAGIVMSRGQRGEQVVFLLPAVLITVAFVIFPTIYALFIAFNSWNLSAAGGRQFNG